MHASTIFIKLADAASAANITHSYVVPAIRTCCIVGGLTAVVFLINGGYQYITSRGDPERLTGAKHIIRNALLGLLLIFAAATLTAILSHAYAGSSQTLSEKLPHLQSLQPQPVSNGLVGVLIKAVTGFLNTIIQSIASPFLKALGFFTSATPLMADNSSVFNLWLAITAITDGLFVLVIGLLGFHVMSASSFGFDEIEFKHLLPRFGLIFLLVNSSIFAIDGIIGLSNDLIHAINAAGAGSVWDALSAITKQAGGLGVASLLIMAAFLIFSVMLLVYYVFRLVTLYLGAVLSPLVCLLWLVPGFRDFSENAAKTYLTTIFVLFVHVIILELAASLFAGVQASGALVPTAGDLMGLIVGLATVIALLKTQGAMMQFSYASLGPRSARKLGGQFVTGISALTSSRGSNGSGGNKTARSLFHSSHTSIVSSTNQRAFSGASAGFTHASPHSPAPSGSAQASSPVPAGSGTATTTARATAANSKLKETL